MKRILSIFKRDLQNSFRDNLLLYMIIMPIILTIGLKFFIPSTQSASSQFALNEALGNEVIEEFKEYGKVEIYSSNEEIKDRVNDIDDIAGITKNEEGNFELILEGNEDYETERVPKMIINDLQGVYLDTVNFEINDIGATTSPIALYGALSIMVTAIMLGGVTTGFNIIDEKESGTIKALSVTPMTKFQFIMGKSFLGLVLPIVHVFIIVWIIGIFTPNSFLLLLMTVVSSLISLLIGFFIGVISNNQISGIANMKGIFVLLSLSVIGAMLLPLDKHIFLYWSPIYWSFMGIKDILLNDVTSTKLLINIGAILGITGIVYLSIKNKIKEGLS